MLNVLLSRGVHSVQVRKEVQPKAAVDGRAFFIDFGG